MFCQIFHNDSEIWAGIIRCVPGDEEFIVLSGTTYVIWRRVHYPEGQKVVLYVKRVED